MDSSSLITYSVHEGIALVALNRPEKRNALSDAMRGELIVALEQASADKAVRAVVVTGNGKSFCSGGDIQGMQQRLLHCMPKPTIAAVNGSSAGLGTDLALCCDFILASTEASFAWSYIHRGLVPDGGGLYFLPRRVGLSRAKELIFSGRRVDAQEALQLGIADRISDPANLLSEAIAWAKELSQGSPAALALGKAILDASFESDAHGVFAQGSQAQSICYTTAEHHQAVVDYLAKTARKA